MTIEIHPIWGPQSKKMRESSPKSPSEIRFRWKVKRNRTTRAVKMPFLVSSNETQSGGYVELEQITNLDIVQRPPQTDENSVRRIPRLTYTCSFSSSSLADIRSHRMIFAKPISTSDACIEEVTMWWTGAGLHDKCERGDNLDLWLHPPWKSRQKYTRLNIN